MKCPICDSEIDKKYDYCRKCAWEFEYYFDELSEEERERYSYRFDVYKKIYQKSILEPKIYKEILVDNQQDIIKIDGLMYQNQPFTQTYTWQKAKEYAKNLRLGGYNNWRLPTIDELKKLVTEGKNGKYYIRKEFANNLEKNAWFWSDTEKDSSHAYGVNFLNGYDDGYYKIGKSYFLCVRR